ncbi:Acetokinase family-domain-containing protein [Podospora conica]|nr:Acetokinase family-domain-containing protein [Schizothecium conicum]
MAASRYSGSTSSFTSSAGLGVPPQFGNSVTSPPDRTFTPTSAVSALTAESSAPFGPLDLGPPGYNATMFLYNQCPDETTVFLGPWEVVNTEPRRVVWQCSYAGEVLEHFMSSNHPSEVFPFTLHAQHGRSGDPRDLELYLGFQEPQRIRYTTVDGILHDEYIEVNYEFTTVECSAQFQGDLRCQELVDWFDVDVVWSDSHRRTDSHGNVRGLGTIQRMKLWKDRYSATHFLTFFANHRRRWKEFVVGDFEREFRQRDDRHRRVQLDTRGTRIGSASSISRRSNTSMGYAPASSASQSATNIRYLGIQFTRNDQMQPGTDDNLSANMARIILSVNAGSSSVKVSVYSAELHQSPVQLAEAQVSGLSAPPVKLTYTRDGKTVAKNKDVGREAISQSDAFDIIVKTLVDDADLTQIKSKDDVGIICHRIVHGGDFSKPQLITTKTKNHIEDLNDLAPLHNANSLPIVRTCLSDFSSAHNVACFDSQFHSTLPPHIRTYPINPEIAKNKRLRKYGFHGISYAFITRTAAAFLDKPHDAVNLIALHLGSGASACAIKAGRSWDTSMGLTPLAGLPGATRSGSVDPSLVFHYTAGNAGRLSSSSTRDLHISRAEEILNKEAGWKALTGTTDFGEIIAKSSDDERMKLAFDLFVDRVCGFVGSYYVSLHGEVDALVFAGGIGEKSAELRAAVVGHLGCLGFQVDEGKNRGGGEGVWDVSGEGARHRVLVCETDEQMEMAMTCAEEEEFW